jgi:hypothetical protein
MKTRTTLLSIIVLLIGIGLLNSSCKKDKDDNNNNLSNNFSVRLADGYFSDYGWVVLHSLDGKEVIDYKKIVGDGIAKFNDINSDLVTVTIVDVFEYDCINLQTGKYVVISTDFAAPIGDWVLRGPGDNSVQLGTAQISMTYPTGNYNEYFLSTTNGSNYSNNVPASEVIFNELFSTLDDGAQYSIYGAVIGEDDSYCNWALDQDYSTNNPNIYNLELNKVTDEVDFTTSQILSYITIDGYCDQRASEIALFSNYYHYSPNGASDHKAYFPLDMPIAELFICGRYFKANNVHDFCRFYDMSEGIPDYVDVDGSFISAQYNSSIGTVTDIQISEPADVIRADWNYYNIENENETELMLHWLVYVDSEAPTISRPVLPQSILTSIGLNIDEMNVLGLSLANYNTVSSHAEMIKRFYIDDVPLVQRFDEAGYSYYFFEGDRKMGIDRKEMDRSKTKNYFNWH